MTPFDLDSELKALALRAGQDVVSYLRVVIEDASLLHPSYWKEQPDLRAIRKAIEGGLDVPGARLEPAYTIVPKRGEEMSDDERKNVE